MPLQEEMIRQGRILFKYRSYLPLLLFVLGAIGLYQTRVIAKIGENSIYWDLTCFIISLIGFVIRLIVVGHAVDGTSGRNTKEQVACRLNAEGIYSLVRHPLYLGNFFMWLGPVMFIRSFWVGFSFCLIYWLYYERIMCAEEEFLKSKFGDQYLTWSKGTPPFFPKLKGYIPYNRHFSTKKILKKEHTGLFGMSLSFGLLEVTEHYFLYHKINTDMFWKPVLITTTIFYLTMQILKKKSKLLK